MSSKTNTAVLDHPETLGHGKMHAAVVEQFGKPWVLQEWDIASPGAGQILVKTEACGVCHTDLHAANGDWPVKPTLPFIPGHEAIGLVAAVGLGVTIVKEGDRVGVPWLYSACGHCEYCLAAWETVCPHAEFGGYTKSGGFAEYILADPNYAAYIPKGLEPTAAAPLICAGVTTYKGIKESGAKPGEWMAISGAGGLDIWQSNMPKPWGCWSARSTLTMANSPMPNGSAPIWYSTPKPATR
jgi:propanol-preferring alcohol dehydrogenase